VNITYEKWITVHERTGKLFCWAATIKFPRQHEFPDISGLQKIPEKWYPVLKEFFKIFYNILEFLQSASGRVTSAVGAENHASVDKKSAVALAQILSNNLQLHKSV